MAVCVFNVCEEQWLKTKQTWDKAHIWHELSNMTRYIQRSWELSCSLSVNHTAYWVRLRGIRWHLVMTKRVLSCHLQLSPLSLWVVFPFCHHLSAPCYRIQLPSKVSHFQPPQIKPTLSLHLPSVALSSSIPLSVLSRSIPYAILRCFLWLHFIWR